ncbi:MAG: hypothetical protein ACE5GX_20860 [Thermoanaerobaculia bacterium]
MIVHFLGVFLVDAGLALATAAVVSLVHPLRFLKITSRRQGLGVLGIGGLVVVLGVSLPASERRIDTPHTALDRFAPTYQFSEHHEIRVAAPPARTFEAIQSVTAREITLFRTLTAIRRFGRSGPENVLNAPEHQPILEVATQTTFLLLAHEPDREIVVGTLVAAPPGTQSPDEATPQWYQAISEPGYVKAVMNFLVEPEGGGSLITTETRVFATDDSARRRFAAYWRVIYPGSALIRRMWLRAIQRRAELLPGRGG